MGAMCDDGSLARANTLNKCAKLIEFGQACWVICIPDPWMDIDDMVALLGVNKFQ